MKIYVSNKEIDDNGLNYGEDDFVEEYFLSRGVSQGKGFEFYDDVGLVEIQSLEQHDAEIKKPLKDTVERLLQEIKDLECLVKLKEQAKQEVIAELEEWAESYSKIYYKLDKDKLEGKPYVLKLTCVKLLQKLEEMKGEKE